MCVICSALTLFGLAPLASCAKSNDRFLADLDTWCRLSTAVENDPAIAAGDKAHEIGRRMRAAQPSPEFQAFSLRLIGKGTDEAYALIQQEAARRGRAHFDCPALKR
jgi:hypothetical protein